MLRADPPPAAGREGLDISAVIHDPDAKTQPGDEPGPASTWITSSSHALTRSVFPRPRCSPRTGRTGPARCLWSLQVKGHSLRASKWVATALTPQGALDVDRRPRTPSTGFLCGRRQPDKAAVERTPSNDPSLSSTGAATEKRGPSWRKRYLNRTAASRQCAPAAR